MIGVGYQGRSADHPPASSRTARRRRSDSRRRYGWPQSCDLGGRVRKERRRDRGRDVREGWPRPTVRAWCCMTPSCHIGYPSARVSTPDILRTPHAPSRSAATGARGIEVQPATVRSLLVLPPESFSVPEDVLAYFSGEHGPADAAKSIRISGGEEHTRQGVCRSGRDGVGA